jgi:hypothetical protein
MPKHGDVRARRPRRWPALLIALLLVTGVASGWLLARDDSSSTRERASKPPAPTRITWNPLARQREEPDTLFLLDVERERTREPGRGGFIMANAAGGELPWRADSKVVAARGRYRTGVASRDRRFGYLWMPASGLLPPREFTVELWLKSARRWGEIADNSPFGVIAGSTDGTWLNVHEGTLRIIHSHSQSAASPVQADVSADVKALPAGRWVNVAFTLRAGTLTLYLDGRRVAERRGIPPRQLVGDTARADGLSIAGLAGNGATDFTISDVRISALARVPGRPVNVPREATLRIDPRRRTGRRVQPLLAGGLHTLGGRASEAAGRGVLTALRTDKLLTATPIKAGAADATHPSRGVGGEFSYDWQVVDRALDDVRRLKLVGYISIDAAPQLLGGSVAPFSGQMLRTGRPFQSPFPPDVPRDLDAFGKMVRDLVHHVVVERRQRVRYWGVWNEPDLDVFWKGTPDDYLRLYDVVARAVKSVDPRLQVGGPESAAWDLRLAETFVEHAARGNVPLDFFSWHYYSGNLGELSEVAARMQALARQNGLPRVPRLVVGEWAWQAANLPQTGARPWAERSFFVNDWAAAFAASSLMEMQRLGVAMAIYTNPVAEPGAQGYEGSGLVSSRGPWATGNVFRLWRMLGGALVASRLNAPPSVAAQASIDGDGRLTVLLSRLQYRPGRAARLELVLPARMAAERVRRHYVIDAGHSNAYDAGSRHAALEAVPDRQTGTRIAVSLPPRSVQLLVIDLRSR